MMYQKIRNNKFAVILFAFFVFLNCKLLADGFNYPPTPIKYYIEKQWTNGDYYFAYLKENDTSLFDESNENSRVLAKLNKSDEVTVILKKMINTDAWVFIGWYPPNSKTGDVEYGWIKESKILFTTDFKPVDKIKYKHIRCDYFDNVNDFIFERNGDFKLTCASYKYDNEKKKLLKKSSIVKKFKGKVYQYDSIIWLKIETTGSYYMNYLFSIGSDNKILYIGVSNNETQDKRITFELFSNEDK